MPKEQFDIKIEGLDKTIEKKPKEDPVGLFLDQFGTALGGENLSLDKIDFSHLSLAQQAESLWSVFQDIKERIRKTAGEKKEAGIEIKKGGREIEKMRLSLGILKKLYEDPKTRKRYLEANQKHTLEAEAINGNLEKYKILRREAKRIQNALQDQTRQLFLQRNSGINEVDLLLFETGRRQLEEKRQELKNLIEEDSQLGALAHYQDLKDYADQLREKGFIWMPSRLEILDEMEEASLSGRPILLSGESGTGKTVMVEQVALRLTGEVNNLTPGKDVRFQDLIAKPKISPDGATYYEYKEIGEAATGRHSTQDQEPRHKGRIVADDEFNLLSEAEQAERLARIAAWVPGKKVRMPVTNQEVIIANNFLYCAMVNLASERYSRKKIPPEVLRKFAKMDMDYPRQTETDPELYEMMLAALMDKNGRIKIAKDGISPDYEEREEIRNVEKDGQQVKQNVKIRELRAQKEKNGKTVMAGGFLWRLSNALGELNKSFSHKETVLRQRGEAQYLKNMVIDIGTTLGWAKEYSSLGRARNLEEFFCAKIQKQFIEREAYSAEDRQLVKDFLRYYEIDVDKNPEERENQEFEIMTPLDVGLLSPRVKYEKIVSEEPILAESFYITPDGKRIEYRIEKYREGEREFLPGQIFSLIDDKGRKYAEQFLGISKENGDPVIAPYKKERKKSRQEATVSSVARAKWPNPETKTEQEIEIDLEKTLAEQRSFYKNKLNLEINEAKIKSIWRKNYAQIQGEMEKYGYDSIIIIPDNLPEEEILNKDLIESMEEPIGNKKKKVSATYQGDNFKNEGSFAGVKNSYSPKYRIVLAHSTQNLEDHPILKNTRNKTVLNVTGLDEQEVDRRIANNQQLPVDCQIEINGQTIRIQAEGQSLEEYIIQQAMFFEKNKKHLDEKGWTWLIKSFSGPRVVISNWYPDDRQFHVVAGDSSYSSDALGLRLSRSFSS